MRGVGRAIEIRAYHISPLPFTTIAASGEQRFGGLQPDTRIRVKGQGR
jgi:hypothetical protein